MKIFTSHQMNSWDAFSITEQQITSDILMEKAASACFHWLIENNYVQQPILIFCGKGNNGGDGLAIARMLLESNIQVTVYILELGKTGSNDFQQNLQRIHALTSDIHFIQAENFIPVIEKDALIIDALFGTGLNKPLDGLAEKLVSHLNDCKQPIISIDIPSGLFCDISICGKTAIMATHTLSFQSVKLAFLFAENNCYVGDFHILNIGLSSKFEQEEQTKFEIVDPQMIQDILRPRNKFSHKGNFGHAALLAGSFGMMGAAVLAAGGCMHSGTGKLTCYIPSCGYDIMQMTLPEAMCKVSGEIFLESAGKMTGFDSIGIGPGIGINNKTAEILMEIFLTGTCKLVLDADALNMLAEDQSLLLKIPSDTVITPHPKEFERLFGKTSYDFERLDLAIKKSAALNIYIVLKGHYTAIITPRGKVYFNSTGNAGMAKAGMGDVLTGILTGLLAQQYSLPEAAILAVYIHGSAGDIAAGKYSQESMQASSLIQCLSEAWKIISV